MWATMRNGTFRRCGRTKKANLVIFGKWKQTNWALFARLLYSIFLGLWIANLPLSDSSPSLWLFFFWQRDLFFSIFRCYLRRTHKKICWLEIHTYGFPAHKKRFCALAAECCGSIWISKPYVIWCLWISVPANLYKSQRIALRNQILTFTYCSMCNRRPRFKDRIILCVMCATFSSNWCIF